jgi:hypothetical protein
VFSEDCRCQLGRVSSASGLDASCSCSDVPDRIVRYAKTIRSLDSPHTATQMPADIAQSTLHNCPSVVLCPLRGSHLVCVSILLRPPG